jgi:hypothetical protein
MFNNSLNTFRLLCVGQLKTLGQGRRTYSTPAQNGTRHTLMSQFFLFSLPDQRFYIVNNLCAYIHISDTVQTVYYIITVATKKNTGAKHVYTNRSAAKFWLEIYRWGAGLVVTGRIRDIGQNVLQCSIQTGISSSHSYCQIFFFMAFLDEAFIRNIIILLRINNTI